MATYDYKLRIHIDQDVCIGAGLCVLSTAEVFDQREEDGVVKLRQVEPDESQYEKVLGAAGKCPSGAITVEKIPLPAKSASPTK